MTDMPNQPDETLGKGKAFFDRADQVAETGNWDFAIEMYIEGLRREPGNVDRGHRPLREVSMNRKKQGGKAAGFMDQLKHKKVKEPLDALLNAEYLLAKDPGSVSLMITLLSTARKLGLQEVGRWICDFLLESQKQAAKPNKNVLVSVIEMFEEVKEYATALQACDLACKFWPDDARLGDLQRDLSANYTIKKGGFDKEGDFTKGVSDLKKQQDLAKGDALLQSKSFVEQQIEAARVDYLGSPTVAGKIMGMVNALLRGDDESYENEAIDILAKANKDTGAYQFKMKIGDIRMKQLTRRYRKLLTAGDKAGAEKAAREQLEFELEEYRERAANYPTDLEIKFEMGRRLYLAHRYDDAIAALQQASRDARRHIQACSYLGRAFAEKGWLKEAAETFRRTLGIEMPEDRTKELRYFLGDVLERMEDLPGAQEQFSQVAQSDYNYRDVRQRIDGLRKKMEGGAA